MALKSTYSDIAEIPEAFQELYTERNGAYELTGVVGIKTQEDVTRVQTALTREREEHKATKEKFGAWGDLNHSEVMGQLDRIKELELAAEGKLDQAGIEEMVSRRLEASKNSLVAPLDRELNAVKTINQELMDRVQSYEKKEIRMTIEGNMRKAIAEAKVIPEAQDDVLMWSNQLFEVTEEGKTVTRDGVGVPPGLDPGMWLAEMQTTKPHWWAQSGGGGARPGNRNVGGGPNPWSAAGWNMTAQGAYLNEQGPEKAAQMAKAAGTTVGGRKPSA